MFGEWEPDRWLEFVAGVVVAQAKSRDHDDAAKRAGELPGFVRGPMGERILVKSHGTRHGGVYCTWVLQWSGFTVHVVNRREIHGSRPNVLVEIPSTVLMELGHELAWREVCRVLKGLGFSAEKAVPSRCDVCVDLVGVKVDEFIGAFSQDEWIGRARKDAEYGFFRDSRRSTGFTLGKKCHLRIYDKWTEAKRDPVKLEIMLDRRWGGDKPKGGATRVEFQMRRDVLRDQFDVQTVEDLFSKLPGIADWLTGQWFWLTDGKPDRKNRNQGRAPMASLWERVKDAFASWTGKGGVPASRRKKGVASLAALDAQIVGTIATRVAMSAWYPQDAGELTDLVQIIVFQDVERFLALCKRKRLEFEARTPVEPQRFAEFDRWNEEGTSSTPALAFA